MAQKYSSKIKEKLRESARYVRGGLSAIVAAGAISLVACGGGSGDTSSGATASTSSTSDSSSGATSTVTSNFTYNTYYLNGNKDLKFQVEEVAAGQYLRHVNTVGNNIKVYQAIENIGEDYANPDVNKGERFTDLPYSSGSTSSTSSTSNTSSTSSSSSGSTSSTASTSSSSSGSSGSTSTTSVSSTTSD
jgi:hypothetical protein